MLKLWNTLHRALEEFKPIKGKNVGLYTCGPTVYNPATIGNLRTYVFEDILKRTLVSLGYKVHHVMNITDVGHLVGDGDSGEDKVEKEAAKQGKDAWDIAKMYERMFDKDMMRLNIITPVGKDRPHATGYIKQQIALVEKLEDKGLTYRISDGIYFDTTKFDGYGKLSGQRIGDKQAGIRIELNREKKHPTDFALWKFSPADAVRQMEWNSPWGRGFPGWHVECSAMAEELLGQPFDIHCGGVDHIAVHHENEIAQSEAAYGKPLANYWVHGEFLLVDGGRMGKSEGNAYLLDDLIAKKFDPLAYRFYCLGTHYRSKLNFTWEGLEGAQNALRKLQVEARRLPSAKAATKGEWIEKFTSAMSDDLNSSEALAVVWEMLKSKTDEKEKASNLLAMDEVLGLGLAGILGKPIQAPGEIVAIAEERQLARESKDWKKSDELRDKIAAKGWLIEDGKNGGYDLQPLS
ncbi:cysteine--tRNA ligase [Candidatus Uhrbacteria bacterium]|nr:cysteine--tRNA ligase [Candidatus Uhrbacteria bacterium]